MTAVNPVGATWAIHRSLSMARIRDEATCWVCTIVPVNDEPLVGLSTSAPSARPRGPGRRRRPPTDRHARSAGRRVDHGGSSPMTASRREVLATEPLDEPLERHVLAEGHPVDLVVAVDHLAVGAVGHRRVAKWRARRPRRCRRSGWRRASARSASSSASRTLEPIDVDHVLGPHHQVDGRLDLLAGLGWRSNTALVGVRRVPWGPPPCTRATAAHLPGWPRTATATRHGRERHEGGEPRPAACRGRPPAPPRRSP